jgi:hypothetical protein
MYVPYYIEGAGLFAPVIPKLNPHNFRIRRFFGAVQHINRTEAFFFELSDTLPEIAALAADNMGLNITIWPLFVPLYADVFRNIKHNGQGKEILGSGKGDDLCPRVLLHIGSIYDGELAPVKPLAGQVKEAVESGGGSILVVLVIGNKRAETIGTENLSRLKVRAGKHGFTASAWPDKRNKTWVRNFYLHKEPPVNRRARFRAGRFPGSGLAARTGSGPGKIPPQQTELSFRVFS